MDCRARNLFGVDGGLSVVCGKYVDFDLGRRATLQRQTGRCLGRFSVAVAVWFSCHQFRLGHLLEHPVLHAERHDTGNGNGIHDDQVLWAYSRRQHDHGVEPQRVGDLIDLC